MKKNFILILMICAIFIVGCEKEKKNVDVTTNVVKNDLSEEQINDLMVVIDKLEYMDFYGKDVQPMKLTNQEILRMSYEILKLEDSNLVGSGTLKFSFLEEVALNYFNFSLEPENLMCDTHFNIQDAGGADIMLYDVNTGVYKFNNNHLKHADVGLRTSVYNNYISGYESEGVYNIVVYKLFSDISSNTGNLNYYSTYNDAKIKSNSLFMTSNFDNSYFNKYSDSLVKYTYTFKLKNDNYILISYDIAK